jgi:hypothetical protein
MKLIEERGLPVLPQGGATQTSAAEKTPVKTAPQKQ